MWFLPVKKKSGLREGGGAERVMEVEKGAERCLVSLSNKESQ